MVKSFSSFVIGESCFSYSAMITSKVDKDVFRAVVPTVLFKVTNNHIKLISSASFRDLNCNLEEI